MLPTPVLTQEIKNIIGKVIDAETKLPIESVAIYTPSNITISNTDGEYELKLLHSVPQKGKIIIPTRSYVLILKNTTKQKSSVSYLPVK
jgi:hypothetical protein